MKRKSPTFTRYRTFVFGLLTIAQSERAVMPCTAERSPGAQPDYWLRPSIIIATALISRCTRRDGPLRHPEMRNTLMWRWRSIRK